MDSGWQQFMSEMEKLISQFAIGIVLYDSCWYAVPMTFISIWLAKYFKVPTYLIGSSNVQCSFCDQWKSSGWNSTKICTIPEFLCVTSFSFFTTATWKRRTCCSDSDVATNLFDINDVHKRSACMCECEWRTDRLFDCIELTFQSNHVSLGIGRGRYLNITSTILIRTNVFKILKQTKEFQLSRTTCRGAAVYIRLCSPMNRFIWIYSFKNQTKHQPFSYSKTILFD